MRGESAENDAGVKENEETVFGLLTYDKLNLKLNWKVQTPGATIPLSSKKERPS